MTEHFALHEFFTTSSKANNTTSYISVYEHLFFLAQCLEVFRKAIGVPIYISSGFRSAYVNKEVGGVPSSAHLLGRAADIHFDRAIMHRLYKIFKYGIPVTGDEKLMVDTIKYLNFDKIIFEHFHSSDINRGWIHFQIPWLSPSGRLLGEPERRICFIGC